MCKRLPHLYFLIHIQRKGPFRPVKLSRHSSGHDMHTFKYPVVGVALWIRVRITVFTCSCASITVTITVTKVHFCVPSSGVSKRFSKLNAIQITKDNEELTRDIGHYYVKPMFFNRNSLVCEVYNLLELYRII